jgi:Zn-dependent protease with chaperone function
MLEFLQYVAALVIVVQAGDPSAETAKRPDWLGIALVLAAFALGARIVGALLARTVDEEKSDAAVPALLLATGAGRIVALVAFYVIAIPFGGALAARELGVEHWFVVPILLALAPFFAMVALLAWGLHPAAHAMQLGARTSLRAVTSEFRRALLPLAPIAAYVVLGEALRLAGQDPNSVLGLAVLVLSELPALQAFFWLALVFGVLLFVPFAMRFALRAHPLGDGPLRERLEAYSRRVGFRARDILVWRTGGDAPNAFVVGALPRFRYVFITDGLLRTLDEEEIAAVFAHEAGHARRGHVPLFFGFTAVLSLVQFVPGVDSLLGGALSWMPPLVRALVVMVVWLGVVFGWISRRFEQEADVFGIETLPRADDAPPGADHPFPRALERIGKEVGAIREVTGWRHFSIADRVAFARQYVADADVRRRTRRSIALLRATLLFVIFGFALAAAVRLPDEIRSIPQSWESRSDPETKLLVDLNSGLLSSTPARRAKFLAAAGSYAAETGRNDAAARWLRESVALDPSARDALSNYAAVLDRCGRPLGAKMARERLGDAPPAGSR